MSSIKELSQRLKEGDDTALEEIRHLTGHAATVLLDEVRDNKEAYRKAVAAILKDYGKQ